MNKRAYLIAGLLGLALGAGLMLAAPANYSTPQIREYPVIATYVDARVLAVASTAEDWTVPAGCNFVVFSSTANFYVELGTGSSAVPSGDVSNGTASALNPSARRVTPAQVLSVVSPTAGAIVTFECYADGGSNVQ